MASVRDGTLVLPESPKLLNVEIEDQNHLPLIGT
jgi:hypothetical protein